jgi:hypothetical protein
MTMVPAAHGRNAKTASYNGFPLLLQAADSPWQKCHFLDRRILPIRAGDSPRESFRIFPSGAIGRVEPREGGPEAQKRVYKPRRRPLERSGLADAVEFAHQ